MSMQSLANKYRPDKFSRFIGQDINVRFLGNLIKDGQKAKNIIFHGPFGSSKTTSLRVFARALNCTSPDSDGSPCNSCENCQLFLGGGYSDYIEVDAASNGDKDSIKNLRDIAQAPPMLGKYRLIALDEVQQISKAGWDALLTLTEESPEKTCFLFSTTEFKKIPETIRSRCFGLEVKLLTEEQSLSLLKRVVTEEGFKYEDSALRVISYISQGHPRDLIKNTEHLSYFGDITLENVKNIFNFGELVKIQDLIRLLMLNPNPNFNQFLKTWHVSVEEMSALFHIFFLHMNYKFCLNVEVDIHPIVPLLDPSFLISIKSAITSFGGSFDKGIQIILSEIIDLNSSNLISFELSLNNLYKKIHQTKEGEVKSPILSSNDEKVETISAKRKFLNQIKNIEEKIQPEVLNISQSSDKVKESTCTKNKLQRLIELGFRPLNKEDIIQNAEERDLGVENG